MSSSHNQRRAHVNKASDDLRKKGLSPNILDVKQVLLVRQLTKILERRKNNNRASDAAIAAITASSRHRRLMFSELLRPSKVPMAGRTIMKEFAPLMTRHAAYRAWIFFRP
ncbi:MAG: hypothetical protein HQ504_06935 [Rhodospirillaceae bacterium]|nr:hypothetical protein [Rhodospirillaceae bacterium]